jgi:hypothetical protein
VRLSNRPCAKCGEDTLHTGPKCTKCDSVNIDACAYQEYYQRRFEKVGYQASMFEGIQARKRIDKRMRANGYTWGVKQVKPGR